MMQINIGQKFDLKEATTFKVTLKSFPFSEVGSTETPPLPLIKNPIKKKTSSKFFSKCTNKKGLIEGTVDRYDT